MRKYLVLAAIFTLSLYTLFSYLHTHPALAQNLNNYLYLNGNVGIGTSSPSAKLDVRGNLNVTGSITNSKPWFIASDSRGWVGLSTGWNYPLKWDTVIAGNSGGWYNTTTGNFTVPTTGLYFCNSETYSYGAVTNYNTSYIHYLLACNNTYWACSGKSTVSGNFTIYGQTSSDPYSGDLQTSKYIYLTAGDTVYVSAYANATTTTSMVYYSPHSQFACALISN